MITIGFSNTADVHHTLATCWNSFASCVETSSKNAKSESLWRFVSGYILDNNDDNNGDDDDDDDDDDDGDDGDDDDDGDYGDDYHRHHQPQHQHQLPHQVW